jgi:hypothetical protein
MCTHNVHPASSQTKTAQTRDAMLAADDRKGMPAMVGKARGLSI